MIYLTPELVEMVEGEIQKREGKGKIFLTVRGRPWKPANLINRIDKLMNHKDVKTIGQGQRA